MIIIITIIYLNVILCLYNAKCFLRAFDDRRNKKLRGRLLVLQKGV